MREGERKQFRTPLGEQALLAEPSAGSADRWYRGIFVGLRDRSSELLVCGVAKRVRAPSPGLGLRAMRPCAARRPGAGFRRAV